MMKLKRVPDPEVGNQTVIPFPNACAPSEGRGPLLSAADRASLEAARWWLIKSRLTAKAIIDEACFLLASGIPSDASAYGTAFFRLLDIHAQRKLHFFASGVEAVSKDELWYLQLINAAIDGDDDSVETLTRWWLDAAAQRRATFLIIQLAQLLQESHLDSDDDVTI